MKKNAAVATALLILGLSSLYAVHISVMPFNYTAKSEQDASADDAMARILSEELKKTRRFIISDYDLLIAYFSAEETIRSYKVLSTNTDVARNFLNNTVVPDYFITGEIKEFSLSRARVDSAKVSFSVNIMDAKTGLLVKSLLSSGKYSAAGGGMSYNAEDAFFTESVLGKAAVIAASNMAIQISSALNYPPLTGLITRIDGSKYYINLGTNSGIKAGNIFEVYKVERVIQPSKNGETYSNTYQAVLSNESGDLWYTSEMLYKYRMYRDVETIVGSARVVELFDNYSILEKISNVNMEVFMRVRLATTP